MKNTLLVALFVFVAFPVSAFAQSYGGYSSPPGFFWPYGTGIGAPREVLTVHAWGPTNAPSYHSMNAQPQQQAYQPMYFPQQQSYPSYQNYQQPMYQYQPSYQQYPQYQQQYQPQYQYQQNYYQPQYNAAPSQPYSYRPQPTGGTDLWGSQLCNWGNGYQGYSCDRDPRQLIYDPYAGSWY